ncbi:MAG: thioesterase [Flavobacteriaceae bacterium]|nr:thioesterase [Flavobacteriaceae bacterium]|tara:strand:- start:23853 stop:24248 length:396 start_codon:yes stop_codon:yes gene_type:complete
MEFITKPILVRYYETDQMGFVHHSNYLRYFELARIEWISSLGFSYQKMEEKGYLMPVINANVNYKKPLNFGKSFRVKIQSNNIPKVKFELKYEVISENNEILATGSTILVFLSSHNLKPVRCPDFFYNLFK